MKDSLFTFKAYLKSKKLKITPEREAIVNAILSLGKHFEADELLVKLRQRKRKIAKASIYRTLKLLVDAGILRPVIFTDRHLHYEQAIGKKHHAHLICLKCGKVYEFSNPRILKELDKAYKQYHFNEFNHKVEATGYCKNCQKLYKEI